MIANIQWLSDKKTTVRIMTELLPALAGDETPVCSGNLCREH